MTRRPLDAIGSSRTRLARLDAEIVRLLEQRLSQCPGLAEAKRSAGLPLRDLAWEAARLRRLVPRGSPQRHAVTGILDRIVQASVAEQARALGAHRNGAPTPCRRVRLESGRSIGGGLAVFAGPCTLENVESLSRTAAAVRAAGGDVLRGGCHKPRTSPYSFQGLERDGIRILARAAGESGLPCVSEVMDPAEVPFVAKHADMLRVGSRSMQSAPLLRAVAGSGRPVLLERGMSATLEEFVHAAEYIRAEGNDRVILCERGTRTFEGAYRATLDVAAIPVLQAWTGLPVVADVSHAAGFAEWVRPLALAAVGAGADGIMVEVHDHPPAARRDGTPSLASASLADLVSLCRRVRQAGRSTRPGSGT